MGQSGIHSKTLIQKGKKKSNLEFKSRINESTLMGEPKFQLSNPFSSAFKESSGNDWNPC